MPKTSQIKDDLEPVLLAGLTWLAEQDGRSVAQLRAEAVAAHPERDPGSAVGLYLVGHFLARAAEPPARPAAKVVPLPVQRKAVEDTTAGAAKVIALNQFNPAQSLHLCLDQLRSEADTFGWTFVAHLIGVASEAASHEAAHR